MARPAAPPYFLGPLNLRLIGPGRWMTTTQLRYRSALTPGTIVVADEFITDLASVPRRPLTYLLAGGRAPAPAVLHDWLYQHPDEHHDRELADAILYEAMGVAQPEMGLPESAYVRWMIWAAVRAAGWHAWNDHRARARALNPIWTAQASWPDAVA